MQFIFKAKHSQTGKIIQGKVNATSIVEVKQKLSTNGYATISVKPVGQKGKSSTLLAPRLSSKEFQVFLKQLSVLLKAGVPLLESVQAIKNSTLSKALQSITQDIEKDIVEGHSLSYAMSKHPKVFGRLVVNLTQAGEEGGIIDVVLDRLAIFFEKRRKLKSQVVNALIYPTLTILVAVVCTSAILIFVIPEFEKLFQSQGQDLPAITKFVTSLSHGFAEYWYLVFFVVLGIPAIIIYLHRSGIATRFLDSIFLRLPLFGSLIRKSAIARMSRTLSTLLTSGIRINDGLEITQGTLGNIIIDEVVQDAKTKVLSGLPFSDSLIESRQFPNIVTQMIRIGETTGNLDEMLSKVADFYEEEVENAAAQMTKLLEPMIIIFMGAVIGGLVISMFLPIFNLGNAVL